MEGKSVINLRGADCTPEAEDEFNKWYDEVHIPMLLEGGEIKRVTRFKRIGEDGEYPKYLVVYEFEDHAAFERYESSAELKAAAQDVRSKWKDGGYKPRWRAQYEVMKSWGKKSG